MEIDMLDRLQKNATVEDVINEVSKIRSAVTDAVDDGIKSAIQAIKQGRDTAEDAIDETKRARSSEIRCRQWASFSPLSRRRMRGDVPGSSPPLRTTLCPTIVIPTERSDEGLCGCLSRSRGRNATRSTAICDPLLR